MLRNANTSLGAVKRHLLPSSSRVRLASTISPVRPTIPSVPPLTPASNLSTGSRARPKNNANLKPKTKLKPKRSEGNSVDEQQRPRRLRPHEVSQNITKLCQDRKVDEAVEYLQNLPLDAQNTINWNILIYHASNARRFRLAHQVYLDMKRRGFKPILTTYATLMGAFNKVDSWEGRTKLLQDVHKIYESYLEYIATVKEHNPQSPEISTMPCNAYIQILSRAGDYQRMFDVYNGMDAEGPFSPDRITYTNMLRAMYSRGVSASGDDEQIQKIRERAASDARLIWRHYMKRLEANPDIGIDALSISSIVQPLTFGRPADHIVAFDIIREYCGLAKPGETAPPAQVELSRPLVQDILWLCNTAQKPRLCVHFVQHLMAHQPDILDHGHFDHVLTAYGSLSTMGTFTEASHALQVLEWMLEREVTSELGPRLRPGLTAYTLVLTVCWRAKDWDTALRTFELMTGYRAADFADGATGGIPQMTQRSQGRNLTPDAAAMSCLVRTALETGDPAAQRQCARIVCRLGAAPLLTAEDKDDGGRRAHRVGVRFQRDQAYYAHKMARAVVELVDALVPKKTEDAPPLGPEEREWVAVRSEAKGFLSAHREHRPKSTPRLEEQPLGSAAGLAATDSAVEWARIHREQKSAR
ncbi:hypothetical protein C8Q78DRAFT_1159874 [Trametes maxima]|nr:hypothetical protein C8Q78DRAFT_1159874 [Trametes maxima]